MLFTISIYFFFEILNLPSTDEIIDFKVKRSYDELTEALNEYLNGDSSTEEQEKEESVSEAPSTTSEAKQTTDAFDDLFNN